MPSKTPAVDLQTVMRLMDPEGAGWSPDECLRLRSHAGASAARQLPVGGGGEGPGREARVRGERPGARNTHFLCFSSQAALSVSRQKFSVTRRSSRLSWSASVYSLSRAVSMSSL